MNHIGLLALIALGIFMLWPYPLLMPLKLLVVFFHEASHALATLLTGGRVLELVLEPQQGGHVTGEGGNSFFILSAGYLGSLAWGAVIYLTAMNTLWDRVTMAILAAAVGVTTLAFAGNPFVLAYGAGTCIAMVMAVNFLSHTLNDFLLRVIGLTSMLYVPQDIYSDTIARSHLRSDARILAEHVGGSTVFWGSVWIVISVLVITFCVLWTLRRAKLDAMRKPRRRAQPA